MTNVPLTLSSPTVSLILPPTISCHNQVRGKLPLAEQLINGIDNTVVGFYFKDGDVTEYLGTVRVSVVDGNIHGEFPRGLLEKLQITDMVVNSDNTVIGYRMTFHNESLIVTFDVDAKITLNGYDELSYSITMNIDQELSYRGMLLWT